MFLNLVYDRYGTPLFDDDYYYDDYHNDYETEFVTMACKELGNEAEVAHQGYTGSTACCVCGGGQREPIVPSQSPSLSAKPSVDCSDYPGWEDSKGITCEDYNDYFIGRHPLQPPKVGGISTQHLEYGEHMGWCEALGGGDLHFGQVANSACCQCGK